MIVVLDTNVFVSALLSPTGFPAEIIRLWEEGEFEVLISPALIDELTRVLQYSRIKELHSLSQESLNTFIRRLPFVSIVVEPQIQLDVIKEDPADNRILECAVAGEADYIVSGDQHLIKIKNYQGIEILSPASFYSLLSLEKKQ